jgi:outer membrane protein OmpA-like peptidoglycan-associated protein
MLGMRTASRQRHREEGEKPFWISFSDLMSALMVLFLVAMTVALLAITNEISEAERAKAQREADIDALMERIREVVRDFPGVTVRGRSVDFGDRARFDTNSHRLLAEQAKLLRALVPRVLEVARDPLGEKWIKRVVVEGFADQRGTYLHNLNLSMQRSQRVLCVLLGKPENDERPLSDTDRIKIRELFLVGGSSFNALKDTLEESRRIEMKLEFLDLEERRPRPREQPLDENPRCPLD